MDSILFGMPDGSGTDWYKTTDAKQHNRLDISSHFWYNTHMNAYTFTFGYADDPDLAVHDYTVEADNMADALVEFYDHAGTDFDDCLPYIQNIVIG